MAWIATIAVTLSNTKYTATAFSPSCGPLQRSAVRVSPSLREAAASAEETAKAMTDYMAKSHEEKLLAIKQVEASKAAEIEVRSHVL